MTKAHAYAYEAGYRDGSIHYELEHCPACKNVADLQEALEENAKLRELVNGLTWCCENYGCGSGCPLYDKSEPDHCREPRLKRELGIEVSDGNKV